MSSVFEGLRDMSIAAVCVRMLLAFLCGAAIGLEREYKRRPAGFRTHILICLGAAMTTLTSQYLFAVMQYSTDISRLGAQVVAGIGFIGAGTIIVTRHQRVKGLTTAAGLWTAAIVGLALGSGFYEGGLIVTGLVLVAELVFIRLEHRVLEHAPEVNLYMEYTNKTGLDEVLKLLRRENVKVVNLEIARARGNETQHACAIFSLRLHKKIRLDQLLVAMHGVEGTVLVEEI